MGKDVFKLGDKEKPVEERVMDRLMGRERWSAVYTKDIWGPVIETYSTNDPTPPLPDINGEFTDGQTIRLATPIIKWQLTNDGKDIQPGQLDICGSGGWHPPKNLILEGLQVGLRVQYQELL